MYRVLLIVCLLSSLVFAQQEAAPVYDPDFEVELGLFNRFFTGGDAQGAYFHAQKMLEIANRKHMPAREVAAGEWAVGEALRKMQRLADAEPHLRRSLALRESVLPKTHYRVLQSLDALGNVLYLENKYAEAIPLTERSLAIFATMPDRDGPDECAYGMALERLGVMEGAKNNLDKAEGLLIRASRSLGEAGLGCGQLHGVFYNLANVFWLENRKAKVEEVYQAAVKVFTPETNEDPDYHYGYYLMCLAGVYTSEKRYDEADGLYKKAIQAASHVESREGPGASPDLLADITRAYKAMLEESGQKGEVAAVEQQQRAASAIASSDSQHPEWQLEALKNGARQAEQEKRFADAEKDLRQRVEVARNLGPRDSRTVLAEVDLGLFLERRRQSDEALRVVEKALAEARQNFNDDPQVLGSAYAGLVVLYTDRHDDPGLESVLKASTELWAKQPNQADMRYAGALLALGQFYRLRKQYAKAEPLYLESLNIVERTQGADSFHTLSAVEGLGYLYKQMGVFDKAETYYRRALALYEKQYGADSPILSQPLYQLAEVMRNLGRPKEADELAARSERLAHLVPTAQK